MPNGLDKPETTLEKIERMDRRIVFLAIAITIILPLIWPLGLPIGVSPQVDDFHEAIESIPDGSVVLFPNDYDPASKAELYPMTVAILHHFFKEDRNLKVIGLGLFPAGPPLLQKAFEEVAVDQYGAEYGKDFVNLGYKEGREIVMASMGESIPQTFPTDFFGTSIDSLPIMQGIKNYSDIAILVNVSAGYPGTKEWVQQVVSVFDVLMVSGTTGVSAPEYYPYYNSGQLAGMLEGLKGAAEYETLIEEQGIATSGMDAQSLGHLVIILFIIAGNVLFILNKRNKNRDRGGRF
ncbi:MAG: hypothetical protein MAGBODY4_01512 [Candidatus Marinimicrobia bacterium]|nr:hypothetical protein [Candidatus Neomarinimicrobiota bacterium]